MCEIVGIIIKFGYSFLNKNRGDEGIFLQSTARNF